MEQQKKEQSFVVELNEAKSEIAQVINNAIHTHHLPCCVIELILSDMYMQIKEGSRNELLMASTPSLTGIEAETNS